MSAVRYAYLNKEAFVNKKRKWLIVGIAALFVGILVGVVTFNLDKTMKAVYEFRDGFIGIPRR